MSDKYKPYPKDTRYLIYPDGRVVGPMGKFLSASYHQGYKYVSIGIGNMQKVARLVAFTFVNNPKPDEYNVVNHINGIKDDDRVENLEWCTQSQNMIKANEIDLLKFGSEHYLSKLDESQVKTIKSGVLEKLTDQEIADYFKVSRATINRIRHGISWKRIKPDPRWS